MSKKISPTAKRVVIDARESGTSTGRYVDKLIEYLHQLAPAHHIILIAKTERVGFFKATAPGFEVVECNTKEFTFAEQLALKRRLSALSPDLVHFNAPQQPVLYRGRTVTTIHDLTTLRFDNPAKNRLVFKLKQQVYKFVVRRVARKANHLIAISDYTKQDIVKFARIEPAKVSVIYEAAEPLSEPARPVEDLSGQRFILYVGRATPHKNLGRLITAFGLVSKDNPDTKLVLAGQPDANYARLQKLVSQNNLTSQVIFAGRVGDDQLRWLYEHALLYVFPSLSEGFGLPGLEAMNYSLPVISSSATCLPEIYKDAALYFDPLDTGDVAAKINQALSDSALRKQLAARGNELVKTYSWAKMAEKTLEVYNQVLNK